MACGSPEYDEKLNLCCCPTEKLAVVKKSLQSNSAYAYCLMPDHLHLVWMGLKLESDQLNGMAFLRKHLD